MMDKGRILRIWIMQALAKGTVGTSEALIHVHTSDFLRERAFRSEVLNQESYKSKDLPGFYQGV
jgi:hypothetical protein